MWWKARFGQHCIAFHVEGRCAHISSISPLHLRYISPISPQVASTEYPVKASEIYEGSWQRGKFHGQGKLFMADGSTREGTWVRNSLREGVGKTYFDSGDVYEGGMVKETMHGMGTYTHADGSVFVGEFVDNLAQGHGRITFAGDSLDYPARAGDRFEGSWQRGAWHGKGTLTRADGTVVEGTWVGNRLVEST